MRQVSLCCSIFIQKQWAKFFLSTSLFRCSHCLWYGWFMVHKNPPNKQWLFRLHMLYFYVTIVFSVFISVLMRKSCIHFPLNQQNQTKSRTITLAKCQFPVQSIFFYSKRNNQIKTDHVTLTASKQEMTSSVSFWYAWINSCPTDS